MNPVVYEINTRCWLWSLSEAAGKDLTLAEVPKEQFEFWRDLGFTHIWLMGVWRTGPRGRAHSLNLPEFREPAFACDEIAGSPYAIADYEVSPSLGGNRALSKFRQRLSKYGIKLILDFVPNHLGHDHHWLAQKPELFVHSRLKRSETFRSQPVGVRASAQRTARPTQRRPRWFAYGKDPFFPGWVDTVQLDYRNPATRRAMLGEIQRIAPLCDGVRCDMAMLLLNDVFAATWKDYPSSFGPPQSEFWIDAIEAVRCEYPDFLFLAEVYWDLETRLQELGFDFTYDKRLYDHVVGKNPAAVQAHLLGATAPFLERGTHFLENHDEQRIASLLSFEEHRAAAVLILSLPGMALLHEGQLTGARERLSVHLGRRRLEPTQAEIANFYGSILKTRQQTNIGKGQWRLLRPREAWPGNPTFSNFVVIEWRPASSPSRLNGPSGEEAREVADAPLELMIVNLAPHNSQCRIDLTGIGEHSWNVRNLIGPEAFVHQTLKEEGLAFDFAAYGAQILQIQMQA